MEIAAEIVDRIEVGQVVDTTGAGDSFAAGLGFGYLEFRDYVVACQYGNAMGAQRCTGAELNVYLSREETATADPRGVRPSIVEGAGMNADFDGADSRWQVVEDGFDPALANTYETLFTTGNGYLGTRGSLEEGHEGALPGTFLRGVFDHHDSAVIDLVKAPDWVALAVVVNGARLDVTSASIVRHRRVLDMREGTLSRETVFEDSEGRRTRVETVRFASSADEHLCCLQARITPENHAASISVHSGVDGTGHNLDRRPFYAEPPPDDPQMKWHKWAKSKHLDEVARAEFADGVYLETRTIDTGITIGYAASTTVSAPAGVAGRAAAQVHRAGVAGAGRRR